MKYIFSFFLVAYAMHCSAQVDTVYYDKKHHKTDLLNAETFTIFQKTSEGLYNVIGYNIEGYKTFTGTSNSKETVVYVGHFTSYCRDGHISSEGNYLNGKFTGEWKRYYDSSDNLWVVTVYESGEEKSLKSYYPNGKLKREETIIIPNEKSKGKCYSIDGRKIGFTPFNLMPKPAFNVAKYLMDATIYPKECREKHIGGQVMVQFVIAEDGSIVDAIVTKKAHPLLDEEALRVVSNMPAWNGATQDDKPVKVYFTLPVTFQ